MAIVFACLIFSLLYKYNIQNFIFKNNHNIYIKHIKLVDRMFILYIISVFIMSFFISILISPANL